MSTEAVGASQASTAFVAGDIPRECDVVMKGGITSGVIYPRAICALEESGYRFRSIGGTSAGAIAAVATAAAQHGKITAKGGEGFPGLKTIPSWLAEDRRLLAMFRPSPATRPAFRLLVAIVSASGKTKRIFAAAWAIAQGFPGWTLAGSLPGIACGAASIWGGGSPSAITLGVIGGAILALLGGLGTGAIAFAIHACRAIPDNLYGLCTGHDPGLSSTEAPLTDWLTDLVNRLAGQPSDRPLTFGDLWRGDDESADPRELYADPSRRATNLEVVTTCLSHARPYRIPFEPEEFRRFYYDPQEWALLFPESVMAWIDGNRRGPGRSDRPVVTASGVKVFPLPHPADLPVVVAARMSLSFPVLLSAVPLYAVDFTLARNQGSDDPNHPVLGEKCWFSDGGISSNFPIHFFDSPLPRRPTFGINLSDFPPDHRSGDWGRESTVELAKGTREGILEAWTRFDAGDGVERLSGFLASILNAMQNWRDNSAIRTAGYRDRIVHVHQAPDEGGLNLDMPVDVIARLAQRGEWAGQELAGLDHTWWDQHRWTRYRITMAALESFLDRYDRGYDAPHATPLDQMIRRGPDDLPSGYRLRGDGQPEIAVDATRVLRELVAEWHRLRGDPERPGFGPGAPKPAPELRIVPKF